MATWFEHMPQAMKEIRRHSTGISWATDWQAAVIQWSAWAFVGLKRAVRFISKKEVC